MGVWFWIGLAATLGITALCAVRWRARPADGPVAAQPAAPAPAARRSPPKREPFHAVAIRHGLEACEPAVKMAGQRFLAGQAPPLPLPGCNAPKCHCRYVHHPDRRIPHNRRNSWSRHAGFDPRKGQTERRNRGDRRQRPWKPPRQP
jgi:hypothetical protein